MRSCCSAGSTCWGSSRWSRTARCQGILEPGACDCLAVAEQEVTAAREQARRSPAGGTTTADLPVVVANASDQVENIPGTVRPHQVVVHPTPTQFVGHCLDQPAGRHGARQRASVAHAHPACGNGISWWLEQRRGERLGHPRWREHRSRQESRGQTQRAESRHG